MKFTTLATLSLMLCVSSSVAQAQAKKETPADALFREGRTLLQAGQVAEACEKFNESQKLDPSAGTLLNLGECYERAGRLVPAYEAFRDAEPLSKARSRQDWADTAKTRAEALRAKIPLVFLDLKEQEHVTVSVDAKTYERDVVALGVMVEIGDHSAIVKSEEDTWTHSFTAAAGSKIVLKPEFKRTTKPAVVRKEETSSSPLKTVGIVAMGVGGASVITGLVFAGLANSKKADVEAQCPFYATQEVPRCTSANATGLNDSAKSLALVSSIFTFAGLGVGVGGIALFLLAPHSDRTRVSVAPGPGLAGLSIRIAR
jgi:hypothetical protein